MAVSDWLENNIDSTLKYTGNGREVHMDCPRCSDTRQRFYVNLESMACHCHNCGWSPNFVQLIQVVEGIGYTQAAGVFKDIHGTYMVPETIGRDSIRDILMGDLRSDLEKRPIPLPDEYTPIDVSTRNFKVRNAINYLRKRNITKSQITDHQFGYCVGGDYDSRIIIPILEQGKLRFWVARADNGKAYMKEKSPSDEDYQISKSEVIFNIDRAAADYGAAVICEGIFDALSFGGVGISLLGKSLYQEQFNILLDYRELLTNGIYIALDYDAQDRAVYIAEQLKDFFDVKMIRIPKELDDPNNCLITKGKRYMAHLIEQAEEYDELSAVRHLLS